MSEKVGSDIERLWDWISRSGPRIEDCVISESFYVGSDLFRHWFQRFISSSDLTWPFRHGGNDSKDLSKDPGTYDFAPTRNVHQPEAQESPNQKIYRDQAQSSHFGVGSGNSRTDQSNRAMTKKILTSRATIQNRAKVQVNGKERTRSVVVMPINIKNEPTGIKNYFR